MLIQSSWTQSAVGLPLWDKIGFGPCVAPHGWRSALSQPPNVLPAAGRDSKCL